MRPAGCLYHSAAPSPPPPPLPGLTTPPKQWCCLPRWLSSRLVVWASMFPTIDSIAKNSFGSGDADGTPGTPGYPGPSRNMARGQLSNRLAARRASLCNLQVSGCSSDQNMFQRLSPGMQRVGPKQRAQRSRHMARAAPGPDPSARQLGHARGISRPCLLLSHIHSQSYPLFPRAVGIRKGSRMAHV